jgi:hypothetical protein
MMGGGLPPERRFVVMFREHRFAKKKKERETKNLCDTQILIISELLEFTYRGNNMFLGGTLILQHSKY